MNQGVKLLIAPTIAWAMLLSLCGSAAAQQAGWVGAVTAVQQEAWLRRGDDLFRVVRGAGILVGDVIESSEGAMVTLTLDDGPALTVGGESIVAIRGRSDPWDVDLERGLLRFVHDGQSPLSLSIGDARLQIERAIVQVRATAERDEIELTAGSVTYESPASGRVPLRQTGHYVAEAGGDLRAADSQPWGWRGQDVRLAAAVQTTPQLQPPTLPPVLDDEISPSSPNDLPPPPDALLQEDDLLEQDEDDELPQLGLDPAATATRSGTNDGGDIDGGIGPITGAFGGSGSLSLGSLSSASGSFVSGGIFGDANQQTFQGQVIGGQGPLPDGSPFPGGIHLVTAETRFPFDNVQLTGSEFADLFSGSSDKFFSIGTGAPPVGQVITNFFTGTSAAPNVIDVPRFDAHLIELDQFNLPDPAQGALDSNIGLTGLIGPDPTGPTVIGTAPLADERAQLNQGATFALGEFLVTANGSDGVTFTIRRSDQDRLIIKDPGGNDANDQVQPNTDVTFEDAVDPRFLPQSPTVKVPTEVANTGTGVADLSFLRRAAFTTLVADQLQDYSRRTGQTRFVVDGKIIDISGYRP